jgi:hypothetical protein
MVQMAQYFHSELHTILVHNPRRAVLCAGIVTSGSDPRSTHNTDNDGGLSGPRRHGLELVRWSETRMSEWTPKRMSEQSWMARVQIVTRTRTEVRMGSKGAGSDL